MQCSAVQASTLVLHIRMAIDRFDSDTQSASIISSDSRKEIHRAQKWLISCYERLRLTALAPE